MARKRRVVEMTPGPPLETLLAVEPVRTLNVHGHSTDQAARAVADFVRTCARSESGQVVAIVTGKGLHSAGAPRLEPLVRRLLDGELARFVAGFSRDSARGRFLVRVR